MTMVSSRERVQAAYVAEFGEEVSSVDLLGALELALEEKRREFLQRQFRTLSPEVCREILEELRNEFRPERISTVVPKLLSGEEPGGGSGVKGPGREPVGVRSMVKGPVVSPGKGANRSGVPGKVKS